MKRRQSSAVSRPRALAAGILLGLLPGTGWAQGAGASAPIAALNAALQKLETSAGQPFGARYNALAPVVDSTFDLQQILQASVGLRFASFSAADKARLLAVFRAYTIANYVANFDKNAGDMFKLLPATRSVGNDTVVQTQIVPHAGDPTELDYVMRQGGGGWRAVDVLETGSISQAAVQRSDFRQIVSSGGASALIASLEKKVATLSDGTIKP